MLSERERRLVDRLIAEMRNTAEWIDERAGVLERALATDDTGAGSWRQIAKVEAARMRGRAFLIRQMAERGEG